MDKIHLRCIYPGHASVYYDDEEIGEVKKIDWPSQRENGEIIEKQVWEARTLAQEAIESPYSFPAFDTRREAVAYLAKDY